MEILGWIVGGGVLMSVIALAGALTFLLGERTREWLVLPLVAFSAGSLLGGAFFHMIPEAAVAAGSERPLAVYVWVVAGFALFFVLEQFLHWRHCHHGSPGEESALPYLMVTGDGIHNFLGGVAVAGAFLVDVRLGITTWLAAAAHELPQELGEYGVLLHGGWSRRRALIVNVLTSLTFLVGGVLTSFVSLELDVSFLVPFAAGNFIYVGASDLVPEVNKHHDLATNLVHFGSFAAGVALLLGIKIAAG